MEKNIAEIFPTVVVGYRNPNYVSINSKLLKIVTKEEFYSSKHEYSPEQTKDNHLERREEYQEIFSWIQECLDDYKKYFKLQTEELKIILSWINKGNQHTEHRSHYHQNSFISGIYYISDNPTSTFFQSPILSKRTGISVKSNSILDNDVWSCPGTTGDLVLFPSWLEHFTEPKPFEGFRYTLSINIMPSGMTNKKTLTECFY